SNVTNGNVEANAITTIINTNSGGYGVRGVIVNPGIAASNLTIRNNFISDIYCFADVSTIYWPVGIDIEGSTGGVSIDFNSINLFGSHTGYTSGASGSADIFIGSSVTGNMSLRNNILSNTFDNSTSTSDLTYCIYSSIAATAYASMD